MKHKQQVDWEQRGCQEDWTLVRCMQMQLYKVSQERRANRMHAMNMWLMALS